MSDTQQRIDDLVKGNRVVLFMKGTALFPQCGFSSRAVAILDHLGVEETAIVGQSMGGWTAIEFALRDQGIPYQIVNGLEFFQRKEIKDIIAYFRLVANPDDEEAIKR